MHSDIPKSGNIHKIQHSPFWAIYKIEFLHSTKIKQSQSEGQVLIVIMDDHGLEKLIHFPTRKENTLHLIITSLLDLFQDIHSPDKLSNHVIVAGTLKT